jgi:DNA-binding response OmpR family regulator
MNDRVKSPAEALPVVLVVATRPVLCDVVATALDDRCGVLAATTFRAAREAARKRPPRVVILDGDLPLAGLPALIDEIRAGSGTLRLLIVEPTIGGADAAQMRALGRPLSRPIHPGQVLEAVLAALEGGGRQSDPVEELLVRVHRSRTTTFER